MVKASQTGGVKPMSIAGRMISERERLLGMTDAERAWRMQWLKDQRLSPNEPRNVPEMRTALYNPFRRAFRWPMDQVEKALTPMMGKHPAAVTRMCIGKLSTIVAITYYAYYYLKYNRNDWTRKGGWKIISSRSAVLPRDPSYPNPSTRTKGAEYVDRGFSKVTLNL
ncbi:NADH dehydrogenase (ubiquinone) B17 subunit [Rhynchophorus ferrugineus]|uniref:NADH dehydrogenase (ubiquinone) B17 subunit n=1 Tax=Rhynchophorus ferrugineus TaxID=354439 RepID=UPI003FCE2F9D